jgi:hypothetical protein
MSTQITKLQYEALVIAANQINKEIAEYNESNDILHPIKSVHVSIDDEGDACFEVEYFRAHSASEESDLYNAIGNIGNTLTIAGMQDRLQHGGNDSFSACYKLSN